MLDFFLATASLTVETYRRGENGLAPLACLHGSSRKGPSFPDPFDMVYDGNFRVTGQHEIAMHAVR